MLTYPRLSGLVKRLTPETAAAGFSQQVVPYLVDQWLNDYPDPPRTAKSWKPSFRGFPTCSTSPTSDSSPLGESARAGTGANAIVVAKLATPKAKAHCTIVVMPFRTR